MNDTWDDELAQQKEPNLTTDDLVLWLGEFTVKEKQQGRMTAFQQQKIQALEAEILKSKSILSGVDLKLEQSEIENTRLKTEVAKLTSSITAAQKEQHPRITQLEDQVHSIALERDAAKKNERAVFVELEATREKLKTLEEAKVKKIAAKRK